MKSPAFQLYAGDFFVDTITWDLDELGLYTRLLFIEWTNGPLPSDPKRLAKIAGTSLKKFNYLFEMVSPKFIQNGEGFLINERLEQTRQAQQQFIENQREKGKKRASERWAGHIAVATKRLQPEGKPEDSSSSSSSSSNNKKNKRICKTPLQEDFKISDRVKKWALQKGYSRLEERLEDFKTRCTAKGYQYVDWDSAFMTAIRDDWARLNGGNGNGRPMAGNRIQQREISQPPEWKGCDLSDLPREEQDRIRQRFTSDVP